MENMVGRKILVVDDEAVLLETMAYNLEQAGYQVITVSDGASALEAARRERRVANMERPQLRL